MAEAAAAAAATPRPGHRLEALAVRAAMALFGALPLDAASGLGGAIGRLVGPRLGVSCVARRNLRRAMPELDRLAVERIVREVWDNLGRTMGELPHLPRLRLAEDGGEVEFVGREHLLAPIAGNRPSLAMAAHVGNWEVVTTGSSLIGAAHHIVYRAANNPLVDGMIRDMRAPFVRSQWPKGASAARAALRLLQRGEPVGMLIDQKMNDGIPVPFFGREAMTAPALAQLAVRFDAPIVPVRCERLAGARFRVTAYPPLLPEHTGDRHADVVALMTRVNALLELWIRERPGQWLWLHRRWPD